MICREICKNCNQKFQYEFTKKSKKFCSRKCAMNYFNHLYRSPTAYPKYRCEKCEKDIQLDFYPTKNKEKWEAFILNFKCNYDCSYKTSISHSVSFYLH